MEQQEVAWLLREKYHGEKTEGFFTDCARLEAGEPLAYIIGSIPFLDCTIYLDSKPLIPRPETEYWVAQAIQAITLQSQALVAESLGRERRESDFIGFSGKVLDLCAGSGAIGVALAKAVPEASITFGEIDASHLPLIQKNLDANLITPHQHATYSIVQSDLFENISGTFDFILTNPPYIDQEAKTTDESVIAHEPHLALWGGEHGLEVIEKIISSASSHLKQMGQLWIEHEPSQSSVIATLAQQNGFVCTTYPDQYQVKRYSVLVLQ